MRNLIWSLKCLSTDSSNWKLLLDGANGLTSCQAVGEFVFLEGIC